MKLTHEFIIVFLLGCILHNAGGASQQNLHTLLKHPHYAERHQHSSQNHVASKKFHDVGRSFPQVPSVAARGREWSNDYESPWSRTSKDYYKISPLKSASVAKSFLVVDPKAAQELADVREANEHFVRMRLEARCRTPQQHVICVRDYYPEKEFLPKCTILYRCTNTSGCCEEDSQCSPKAMQEVVLNFYVVGEDRRSSEVEKLLFVNHTECECQAKPTSESTTGSTTPTTEENIVVDHFPQKDHKYSQCRQCPSPFSLREWGDGRCSCDCFVGNKPCIKMKRGREPLHDADRRCVLSGRCNLPDCEYGEYDTESGRCPKKTELDGAPNGRRAPPNIRNPNHRWTYFERD